MLPKRSRETHSLSPRSLLPGSLTKHADMVLASAKTVKLPISERVQVMPPVQEQSSAIEDACLHIYGGSTASVSTVKSTSCPSFSACVNNTELQKTMPSAATSQLTEQTPGDTRTLTGYNFTAEPIVEALYNNIPLSLVVSPIALSSFASCLISPIPNVSFSPVFTDETTIPLLRALYELHESEIAYVNALRVLSSTYLDQIYPAESTNEAVPIIILKQLLERMLITHSQIANGLWDILRSKRLSVTQMTVLACKLVALRGTTIFYYEEYCNNYDRAMAILTNNETPLAKMAITNDEILTALRNYLEITQPVALKGDLSLASLALRPIMRIPKYRLLLELMERRLTHEGAREAVRYYLANVKAALRRINDNGKQFKERTDLNISSLLSRKGLTGQTKLVLDFFGVTQLVGAMTVVWVERSTSVKYADMACILFKSHLMCCEQQLLLVFGRRRLLKIRYLIPLSRCRLYQDSKDFESGLNTAYPYALKLVIEHGLLHYELLLLCLTKSDHEIWCQYLATFVNEINGPYNLDFSHQDSVSMTIIPDAAVPSDVCLNDIDTYQHHKQECYFRLPIPVSVHLSFGRYDKMSHPVFASHFNLANTSSPHDEQNIVYIYQAPREALERILWAHWSHELPRYFAPSCSHKYIAEKGPSLPEADIPSTMSTDSILMSPELQIADQRAFEERSKVGVERRLLAKVGVDPHIEKLYKF